MRAFLLKKNIQRTRPFMPLLGVSSTRVESLDSKRIDGSCIWSLAKYQDCVESSAVNYSLVRCNWFSDATGYL